LNPAKFHSGGREDIDVRMLSTGRPFALEFCSPRFNRIENDPDGIVKITD
jgi:tRNA U54 and U55 pseudouridine synthase Pus10